MLSLGFMALSLTSESQYFTEIARRAEKFDISCFRFIPSKIHPLTEKVMGERFDYQQKKWISDEFTIPEYLYDRCFYIEDTHSTQCRSIVNWLKTRKDITFLGYGLPDKLKIFTELTQSKLAPYLIKTEAFQSAVHLLESLKKTPKILIKPSSGSGGFNIYYFQKTNTGVLVKTNKGEKQLSHLFLDEYQLSRWIDRLLVHNQFLMQPYLPLTNKEGQPFDLRILLQKNNQEEWKIAGKAIRQGKAGSLVSNLQQGASSLEFEKWFSQQPDRTKSYLLDELDDLLTSLSHQLEKTFSPLFEIGVDIGLSSDGALWILDINSKPGRKALLDTIPGIEERLYTAPLYYAKALNQMEGNGKGETIK
ncbi:YheC/YheD family protein [Cytobacillus sp. Hz8]|uniref:YheC/YheD family endospore coat-associated protein n=1 Tax=Cytobacillus sp. Hz8 TaxID=3347168 RepID=UPI0035DDC85A